MISAADWADMFIPQMPLFEIVVRGSVTYLVLYALLRFVRRDAGTISVTDLLVLVLIADAAQNAMAADYQSITDGLLLVAVIIGWAYAVNWLGYHVSWIGRLVHPPAVPIIERGQARNETLRKFLVTHDELLTQLRLQGVADVSDVEVAYVEGNGQITVLTGPRGRKAKPKVSARRIG